MKFDTLSAVMHDTAMGRQEQFNNCARTNKSNFSFLKEQGKLHTSGTQNTDYMTDDIDPHVTHMDQKAHLHSG